MSKIEKTSKQQTSNTNKSIANGNRLTITQIKIPFHDIDSMNVVWHGRYVKYLEIARCELLESFNYGYKAMQDSGYVWPIIEMNIRYASPLTLDQEISIQSTLVEWEHRIKVRYLITDTVSGKRLSKASTTQVAVNTTTQEMQFESPPILLEKLAQ